MCENSDLKISVGIVALNEEQYLPDLLSDILQQTYKKESIELLFIDSDSTDKTFTIFSDFKEQYENIFFSIQILKNPQKKQAFGWNIAILNFKGDALIRLDAHARIPSDFVEKNVFYLAKGENVVGGLRSVKNKETTPWKNTLLVAELSLFGSSIAGYRRKNEEKYVNSMFHACYRRNVLENVGLFNVNLGRTEDNEFHYRIRKKGYKLYYNSEIFSYQLIRSSLKKMIVQKFSNGYWIGKTLFVCPNCLAFYHFVPFFFVLAILMFILISFFDNYIPLLILFIIYGFFDLVNTLMCIKNSKFNITTWALIFIFPLLHLSYGIGTLFGIINKLLDLCRN